MDRVVAFGPGRVNLVGEHTDYNDGLCLAFAIDRGVTVTVERRPGETIEAVATDLGEEDHFPAAAPGPSEGWRAFVRGVVAELGASGVPVGGARIELHGDVPLGSGLSSSAALSTALCAALLGLAGRELPEDRRPIARLCSRVENAWVGAKTGLLDQMAVLCSAEGRALRLDCRDLTTELIPLELGAWRLAVADSGEQHENAASGYNDRRRECSQAAARLGVASLRDADAAAVEQLPPPWRQRARHVICDNARVDAAAAALRSGEIAALGPILDDAHRSLRDDFEISTPTVDRLAARLRSEGALGARIVGGGFGGSVLALFGPGTTLPDGCLAVTPSAQTRLLR